jgi:hypothetical protein
MAEPTDNELALEASAIAERANAYAEANIPEGAAFDATYRAMEAEFTRLYKTLLARGWSWDYLANKVTCLEG